MAGSLRAVSFFAGLIGGEEEEYGPWLGLAKVGLKIESRTEIGQQ